MNCKTSRVQVFERHRAELNRLAYRMTGSRVEAEDLVQEAWLRFADKKVTSARAFLYRVVTRLCLDHLKSARKKREAYPGPWLPEPIVEFDAAEAVEMLEELTMALLLALERLSPLERAAYLLREVYDFHYDEIADLLDRSNSACRQLASRARSRLRQSELRAQAHPDQAQRVVQELVAAIVAGDMNGVVRRLRDDAVFTADGGGKATAALRPIHGADAIARFFLGIFKKLPASDKIRFLAARVGGLPGIVVYDDGVCTSAFGFEVSSDEDRVAALYGMRNPDKLARVSSPGDSLRG